MNATLFIVLTELGGRGDTVFVKKSVGRNKLLLQGLAVYPSPENKHMFAEELRVCIAFKKTNNATKRANIFISFYNR